MARVIRIEHVRAYNKQCNWYAGCFYSPLVYDIDYDIRRIMQNIPLPDEWFYSVQRDTMIFAFTSVDMLRRYFPHEVMAALSKAGFCVAVYETCNDNTIVSPDRVQCIFDYRHAKKVVRKIYKDESTLEEIRKAA